MTYLFQVLYLKHCCSESNRQKERDWSLWCINQMHEVILSCYLPPGAHPEIIWLRFDWLPAFLFSFCWNQVCFWINGLCRGCRMRCRYWWHSRGLEVECEGEGTKAVDLEKWEWCQRWDLPPAEQRKRARRCWGVWGWRTDTWANASRQICPLLLRSLRCRRSVLGLQARQEPGRRRVKREKKREERTKCKGRKG